MTNEQLIGKPVTSLQTMLWTIAQVAPEQPTVIPDGVYGEQTVRAVSEFQRQHGLETTGITDYETWNAIKNAYDTAAVEVAPAFPLAITLKPKQVFLPGSRNRHIYLIQSMMMALAEDYIELQDVHVSGIYDESTQKAVRWLQSCCDDSCSGIFSKATWKKLVGLYTQTVGNGEKDLQV